MPLPTLARPDTVATPHRGGVLLRSPTPLRPYARCVGDWLVRWAAEAPDRVFLAERDGDAWRRWTYAQALADARALGGALLGLGASPARPLLVLADNGVDHARLAFAAMHVGVPVAPVSPAYALLSTDFERLRAIAAQLAPGAVFVADRDRYGRALDALGLDVPVLAPGPELEALAAGAPGPEVDAAFSALGPDTVAKILFTSGSTGAPKGVVNTHRMICSNQAAIAQAWPFLEERPPVFVDWLPWSHTFGGNHNLNMALRNGGTLHVDGGRPAPGLVERTVANLREVSPTVYFNVPRGFDQLLPFLEADEALRTAFFRELQAIFYAAAALPPALWARLEAVAARAGRDDVFFTSAWGSTETAPLSTSAHFVYRTVGNIGVPAFGTDLALVPVADRLEIRVRGPNVTPGTWNPGWAVTPVALDDDGFLPTGDAARLEDPDRPERGVLFEGRIGENFKLASGTWVVVGRLRLGIVDAAAGLVQDAVIAGHDREELGVLLFLSPGADRAALEAALRRWNAAHPGNSERVARALVLADPPSLDAGETTDKGYLNQRRVLERRADAVARLFADEPGDDVIVLGR